jgi:hypothetical protein
LAAPLGGTGSSRRGTWSTPTTPSPPRRSASERLARRGGAGAHVGLGTACCRSFTVGGVDLHGWTASAFPVIQPNRNAPFTHVSLQHKHALISTNLLARPPSRRGEEYLGLVGPILRAEVGDTIKVVFKNDLRFPTSMHPHGVAYTKASEGAPYADGSAGGRRSRGVLPRQAPPQPACLLSGPRCLVGVVRAPVVARPANAPGPAPPSTLPRLRCSPQQARTGWTIGCRPATPTPTSGRCRRRRAPGPRTPPPLCGSITATQVSRLQSGVAVTPACMGEEGWGQGGSVHTRGNSFGKQQSRCGGDRVLALQHACRTHRCPASAAFQPARRGAGCVRRAGGRHRDRAQGRAEAGPHGSGCAPVGGRQTARPRACADKGVDALLTCLEGGLLLIRSVSSAPAHARRHGGAAGVQPAC